MIFTWSLKTFHISEYAEVETPQVQENSSGMGTGTMGMAEAATAATFYKNNWKQKKKHIGLKGNHYTSVEKVHYQHFLTW